jgi:hypothetical protein
MQPLLELGIDDICQVPFRAGPFRFSSQVKTKFITEPIDLGDGMRR